MKRPAIRLKAALEGGAVRIAFLGEADRFAVCALEDPVGPLIPRFFEYRVEDQHRPIGLTLQRFDPHVIVAFHPEWVPSGALDQIDAVTVAILTEPLPRGGDVQADPGQRFEELKSIDGEDWDRILSFDPLIAHRANEVLPVWRSMPLPFSDRYFTPAHHRHGRGPRTLFVGRSNARVDEFLGPAKRRYDVAHVALGVIGDRLIDLVRQTDVGLNLHDEPYPSFESRVSMYCAAGLLLVSEELSPTHGLEPGIDFLQIDRPGDLLQVLFAVSRDLSAFDRVRLRGRQKAERFRASRAYGQLVADLVLDLTVFGGKHTG